MIFRHCVAMGGIRSGMIACSPHHEFLLDDYSTMMEIQFQRDINNLNL